MTNPLLDQWTTRFELPPFDKIKDEDFAPAFDVAIVEARSRINAIAESQDPPTFANVIDNLELAETALDRVAGVFYNLAGADSTAARQALERDLAPKMAAFSSEVTMNAALFAKIDDLWLWRETIGITPEQLRVLTLYRRMFVRAGADLTGEERNRMKAIKERLAVLSTAFSQNVLADEREWFMELQPDDLQGLPDFVVASARAAAVERDRSGYLLTLSRSLIVPFLQFSPLRDLREIAYKAWVARAKMAGQLTIVPLQPKF
jgi:peptidyl-dipeptidase Dcp